VPVRRSDSATYCGACAWPSSGKRPRAAAQRLPGKPCHFKTAAEPDLVGVLKVGNVVFISKRHVIDCSGGVLIDDWSGLAGRGVFIYSHSYDPEFATMTCAPTRIGKNCMVAAMTTLAMGSTLPDASILAMGGVLMPGAVKTYSIYGGVPAKPLSTDIKGWKYLNRTQMTPSNKKGQACPRRRCRRRTDSPHRLTHRFDRD
jgi:acetyltransferase-like isoleucine patch superfamily enzyme